MNLPLEKTLKILLVEAFLYRRAMVAAFFAILAIALIVGWYWPKSYVSSATVIADERNIITPLMQGAAVPTEITDRTRIAREIIHSRKIMDQLIEALGLVPPDAPPVHRANVGESLRRATNIALIGTNVIKIEYKDRDPERAFQVTQKLVEFFMAETAGTKARESESAYKFIDAQVKEYEGKLATAEKSLKEFRAGALLSRRSSTGAGGGGGQSLQARLEQTELEIKEAEIRKTSLEKQLSGERQAIANGDGRRLRERLQQLQTQLSTLRLSYQDTYPDVARVKEEIEGVKKALAVAEQNEGDSSYIDEASGAQFRQTLRQDLSQTETQLAALNARLAETQRLLAMDNETSSKVFGGITLSELLRDYEINQAILDDLLKRRENARVSMNLDRDKQGLSFRVHDAASVPLKPGPPLYWHFALAGLLLGLVLPFSGLYAKQQMDARVRSESTIVERLGLPVVTIVPHLSSPEEAVQASRGVQWLAILAFTVVFVVVSVIVSGSQS